MARPKSEKAQRTLALPDLAIHALGLARKQNPEDRMLAGDDWREMGLVFPNPTGGIRDGSALRHNFQIRLERHGVEPIRWHALRRVFAAVLQDGGIPLERIRDLMGHSDLRVTESYAYTMPDTLARDMDVIDGKLGRGTESEDPSHLN